MEIFGTFLLLQKELNFKIKLTTLGYNIYLFINNDYISIEKYTSNSKYDKLYFMINECYLTGNLYKIVDEFLNYNVPNKNFITVYNSMMITIYPYNDNIHKIKSLSYTQSNDVIKISCDVASKIYNDLNNLYDYSIYTIKDFMVLNITDIDYIITTLNMINKYIDINKYVYELQGIIDKTDYSNVNIEDTIDSINSLGLFNINDNQISIKYINNSLNELYNKALEYNANENIKEYIKNKNYIQPLNEVKKIVF